METILKPYENSVGNILMCIQPKNILMFKKNRSTKFELHTIFLLNFIIMISK